MQSQVINQYLFLDYIPFLAGVYCPILNMAHFPIDVTEPYQATTASSAIYDSLALHCAREMH